MIADPFKHPVERAMLTSGIQKRELDNYRLFGDARGPGPHLTGRIGALIMGGESQPVRNHHEHAAQELSVQALAGSEVRVQPPQAGEIQ